MYLPIHIHGHTLFPKARFIDGCWQPMIEMMSGTGQITLYQCLGGYPAGVIAVAFARIEMRQLARALKESCGHLDNHQAG
jgi:hypothetical protein